MRNALLKRASAGFMAAAMAAGMFIGMSLTTSAAGVAPGATAVTGGGFTIKEVKVDGVALTSLDDAFFSKDLLTLHVDNLAKDKVITATVAYNVPAAQTLTNLTATEWADNNGTLPLKDANNLTITGNVAVAPTTASTQAVVTDLKTGTQTATFNMTVTKGYGAGALAFVKLSEATEAVSSFAFWSSITGRRQIAPSAVKIDATDSTVGTITIDYSGATVKDLWQVTGDTLPTITIGQTKAGTIDAATQSSDYVTGTVAKTGDKVKLNGVTYTVTFKTLDIQPINATTLTDTDLRTKMAYSFVLSIGGTDYTLDKKTLFDGTVASVATNNNSTVITFNKITSLTGSGVITFKGAYLWSDQAFTATAAALTSDAGVPATLTFKDGSTQKVFIKANAASVTASSTAYNSSPVQVDTKDVVDGNKKFSVLINGAASTQYPRFVTTTSGLDVMTINLVNDVLPSSLQVKLENKFIAGGSKTLDVKFYDQVFPIELADGAYTYVSVIVKSLKNDAMPVAKFDLMAINNDGVDMMPATTWNQSRTDLNKILFIDQTGVLTDRTVPFGVLTDGVTDKIRPSTSFYRPNSDYDKANWFYIRWKIGDTLYGTSVKHTRDAVTFDVTDPTTKLVYSYTAYTINPAQAISTTAINSTIGGQSSVAFTAGNYNQTWKADAITGQSLKDTTTTTKGAIAITNYFSGTPSLDNDYTLLTLRLPRGVTLTMDGKNSGDVIPSGSIKSFTVLQSYAGTVGNTTTDGLVDYVVKFQYRELVKDGSATGGANVLKVTFPLTNKDGKDASATSFMEYNVTTTWVAKSYAGEKKVTMAGITVPDPIVTASSSAASSSVAASQTSTVASSTISSSKLPTNPNTGVPFDAIAYVMTIAASAIGGVSTMIIRKK